MFAIPKLDDDTMTHCYAAMREGVEAAELLEIVTSLPYWRTATMCELINEAIVRQWHKRRASDNGTN